MVDVFGDIKPIYTECPNCGKKKLKSNPYGTIECPKCGYVFFMVINRDVFYEDEE